MTKSLTEQKKIFDDVKENGYSVIEKQAKELFPSLFKAKESK